MQDFYWIAVAVVLVTSSARVTRLLTWDKFPPIAFFRDAYADWTDKTDRRRGWQVLAFCGYCMSFWVTLGLGLWGWLTDFQEAWWVANGILGASYLAAILMAFDGDDGDED